jgi:nitrate/TMAO reductase-like tetraheme cytochrome c subunit
MGEQEFAMEKHPPSHTGTKKGAQPIRSNQRRKPRGKFLILMGINAALILLSAGGGTAYAIHQENKDSFCASCHTSPETSFYQQSMNAAPVTLAASHSQKSVRCIDCHSGSGPLGRAAGLAQGAQDLIAYQSGNYHNPAVTTHPLDDASCLKCHNDLTTRRSFNNHFHVFLIQWQNVDPNAAHCVDCHTSHSNGSPQQGFLQEATVRPTCDRCHQFAGRG